VQTTMWNFGFGMRSPLALLRVSPSSVEGLMAYGFRKNLTLAIRYLPDAPGISVA